MLIRWSIVLVVALLLFAVPEGASAQTGPSLFIDPPSRTVALDGGAFEVRVMVDDVTTPDGLGGYTLAMHFDPAIVKARTITDSGFVASTENPVICPASGIDNDEGLLAHLCFTLPILPGPGPQASDPQALARISFEPLAAGTTTLDISETTIIDPAGNTLEATTRNGEVTVLGPGGPVGGQTPRQASPTAGPAAETPATGTGGTALPSSGNGPGDGSDARLLYISLILVGAGVIGALAAVAFVRTRKRAH